MERNSVGYDRVRAHGSAAANARIDQHTIDSVREVSRHDAAAITRRIEELDREWDIDRRLIAMFAVANAVSSSLGFYRYITSPRGGPKRKGFFYLFGAQLGFAIVHAAIGWCPPVPLLRRLGVRTKSEIEAERRALVDALTERTWAT